MHLNFETLLTGAVVLLGFLVLIDKLFFARKRKLANLPLWVEYSRSFFPILLLVLVIRSFLFEPFRIPSGSLMPTLVVGDFILTNKFSYGIRLPVLHKKVFTMNEPQRGDIAVFRYPSDPRIDYIKRIVGIPGDRLSYIDKVLYINDQPAEQITEGYSIINSGDAPSPTWQVVKKQENLMGIKHGIYQRPAAPPRDFYDVVVPEGHYFMMGDNRDDSGDSRSWGFVSEKALIGQAIRVWFSWDNLKYQVRWNRIGMRIE